MAVQERVRLYKISRSPHGHARQIRKVKWSAEQRTVDQSFKAANAHTIKDRVTQAIPLVNKCRNERPRILICSITNRLESKFIESISTPSKSFTPIRIWKTSEKRMTDTLTNLIQHIYRGLQPNDDYSAYKALHHHQMCTTFNNTIQQS